MSREVDGEAEGWLWLLKCNTKLIRTTYPAPDARQVGSQPCGFMWPMSGEEGTRIARIRRILTDQVIRENPYNPCHPYSI
jgi:hypothetical protein